MAERTLDHGRRCDPRSPASPRRGFGRAAGRRPGDRRAQQRRAGQLRRRPDRAAGQAEPGGAFGQCRYQPGRPAAAARRAPPSPIPTRVRSRSSGSMRPAACMVTRGDESARGDVAIYDFNRRIITMVGGVALRRGSRHAQRRAADDRSRQRHFQRRWAAPADRRPALGTSAGGGGGRVTGSFSVPKRD